MINNRQNNRRRGRGGGGGGGGPRSNGSSGGGGNRIDNRARGNASQLHEKYKTLARDAQTQGDRVMTEYYLQFADHYYRILNENRARFEEQRPRRDDQFDRDDRDDQDEFGGDGDMIAGQAPVAETVDAPERPAPRQPRFELEADAADEQPRRRARNGNGGAREEAQAIDVEAQEQPRPRRGRPRRERQEDEGEGRIEMAALPPALAAPESAVADGDDAPKPKRRGRPPKASTAVEA